MISKTVNKLLTNKYVLYGVLFLSITNVLGYFSIQDFDSIILFILVGFITSYFSKNMIIILATAMTATNLNLTANKVRETMAQRAIQRTVVAASKLQGDNILGYDLEKKRKSMFGAPLQEGMSNRKEKETMENDDAGDDNDVNYDDTLTESYDNLQKLLGNDGIGNLTKDTMQLMDRQKDLAESMKTLEPMLNNAKSMLKGFDMKNIEGLTKIMGSLQHGMGGNK